MISRRSFLLGSAAALAVGPQLVTGRRQLYTYVSDVITIDPADVITIEPAIPAGKDFFVRIFHPDTGLMREISVKPSFAIERSNG